METHGDNYTVDLEVVEDHMGDEQHALYSAVLEALKPTYTAAVVLWNEHVVELQDLERVSAELHSQAVRAAGSSSIPPFKINRPSSAPPASTLERSLLPGQTSMREGEDAVTPQKGKKALPVYNMLACPDSKLMRPSSEGSGRDSSDIFESITSAGSSIDPKRKLYK